MVLFFDEKVPKIMKSGKFKLKIVNLFLIVSEK